VDVPTIHSARLDLVSMSSTILEALTSGRRSEAEELLAARLPNGWPADGERRLFRLRLDHIRSDAAAQPWLLRALVLRRGREMIGHAGFHGPPGAHGLPSSAVEVGYTVFEPFRGRGYATEAAVALLEWAEEQGISHFVASVAPVNEPSLAIVRKLGFVRTGEHWDEEDGLEHVFERTASSRVASAP
jgi:ribosomal-protein-alanine N-acetyltransferase